MNASRFASHMLLGKIVVIVSIVALLTVVQSDVSAVTSCPRKCECFPNKMIDCIGESHTKIHEKIPDDTSQLFLYRNSFDSPVLRRANLSRFTNLEILHVRDCGIESIDADTFQDLNNLQGLYLDGNRIKLIQENTFSGLNLFNLDLTNNRGIKLVLDSFSGLSVKVLQLDRCSFRDLNPEIFLPLKSSLTGLRLNHNELTHLDERFKTVFGSLNFLDINANPFVCDCNLSWLKNFVDSHRNMFRYNEPSCQSPAALKGRDIIDLPSFDFRCQF